MRTVVVVLALSAMPALGDELPQIAPGPPAPKLEQKRSGFALEVGFGSTFVNIATGGTATSAFTLRGGLFAGYKIDRVMIGLELDLSRLSVDQKATGSPDRSDSSSAFTLGAGVRIAVLRSRDAKVEMYGQLDFGGGRTFLDQQPAPMGNQPSRSNFHLVYQVGPGVRYWVHPQFAVSALIALRGAMTYASTTTSVGVMEVTTSQSTLLTSIFAGLQFTGVF